MKKILIIGGGISGLTAAYRLTQSAKLPGKQISITLLESSERLGGKIITESVQGAIVEGGPDSFITLKPQALDLVRELGIGPKLLPTNQTNTDIYVYARGQLRRMPEGLLLMAPSRVLPFFASNILSWPGKIRMGFDFFSSARSAANDESLGNFTRRHFGSEALETIVQPIMAGIFAGDADQLSLKSTFPRFLELEQKYGSIIRGMKAGAKHRAPNPPGITSFMTLTTGLKDLVDALTSRIKEAEILLSTRAVQIQKHETGYTIETSDGKKLIFDAVILATPAWVTAKLLGEIDAGLSGVLSEIPFASSATVSFLYDEALPNLPAGFGFVVRRGENTVVSAGTFTSSKFPQRVPAGKTLIRCFLGGAGNESILQMADDRLAAAALGDLKTILGIDRTPVFSKLFHWENANPQYAVGHELRLGRIQERIIRHPGLFLAGASYRGIGIPDCIDSGTAAARSCVQFLFPT